MEPQTTFDIITTAASGSVFGLVGSGASKVANHIRQRQTNAHQERKWNYEIHCAQNGVPLQQTTREYVQPRVEGIRSLFRPVLTAILLIACFYMYVSLTEMAQKVEYNSLSSFSPAIIYLDQTYELIHYIVHAVVFSTTTAIVWWFGDRGSQTTGTK